jgi:protease I
MRDVARAAFVVANEGIELVELVEPRKAVEVEGWQPVLVAPKAATAQAMNHFDKGDQLTVGETTAEATADRGRTLTSSPSLRTAITNAGGNWVDEEVQVCRDPQDLPKFCEKLVEVFGEAPQQSQVA